MGYMETCIALSQAINHFGNIVERQEGIIHPDEMRAIAKQLTKQANRIAALLDERARLCENGEGEMPEEDDGEV